MDWEFAKIGNPAEDLSWALLLLWNQKDYSEYFINEYNKLSKYRINKKEFEYWTIFSYVRFSCIASQQYERSLVVKDIDLHITGWRVLQIEKIIQNKLNLKLETNNNYELPILKDFIKCAIKSFADCILFKYSCKRYAINFLKGIKIYLLRKR